MPTKESLNVVNTNPQKKEAFIKALDQLLKNHGIQPSSKWGTILASPQKANINPAASSVIITITA